MILLIILTFSFHQLRTADNGKSVSEQLFLERRQNSRRRTHSNLLFKFQFESQLSGSIERQQ